MSTPHPLPPDEAIEAALDDLQQGQCAALDPRVAGDSALSSAAGLQQRIDGRLARLFQFDPPPPDAVASLLGAPAAEPAPALPRAVKLRRWHAAAALAAAAAIAWAVLTIAPRNGPAHAPLFAFQPLREIYRETVAQGFEPYYECREADRFADTFARRQGLPLQLLPLPVGSSMLGLSYPGGLSRHTTAMLGRVDGQPVMVFVDRAAADQPGAAAGGDASLRIFRAQRDGLVFYEVTPLGEARLTDYLAPVERRGAAPQPSTAH
ncbi:MAG: hypothetical protein IT424_12070 [Pirellulales bacterium]|nr:hypothetical protein [Pirellulales bacterium]